MRRAELDSLPSMPFSVRKVGNGGRRFASFEYRRRSGGFSVPHHLVASGVDVVVFTLDLNSSPA